MQKLDTENTVDNQGYNGSDEDLLMNYVIQDDHELMYMDAYMSEFMNLEN